MRLGRLRWSEVAILTVSIGLTVDLFAVDWFRPESGGAAERGLDSDLFGVLVAVVAGLGFVAVLQTAMRRAATGGLAAHVALAVACPLVLLVGLVSASGGGDGLETASGVWLALLGTCLLFGLAVVALRDESRGFKPDPGATVLEMPPLGDRTQSADG
ncbi:MAG: hypothetical protein WCO96_04230 [Actinomycetes bacterium]